MNSRSVTTERAQPGAALNMAQNGKLPALFPDIEQNERAARFTLIFVHLSFLVSVYYCHRYNSLYKTV